MSQSTPTWVSDPPHNVLALDDKKYSRLGWWLVLGGFAGFLGWAALAPLDKGVAAPGLVEKPMQPRAHWGQHEAPSCVCCLLTRTTLALHVDAPCKW